MAGAECAAGVLVRGGYMAKEADPGVGPALAVWCVC